MLDVATREFLEKTIDEAKCAIPDRLIEAREFTKVMFIQNSEDYILGWAVGYVVGAFITFFAAAYLRRPNEQQLKEAREVISSRTAELREAIFKPGWVLDFKVIIIYLEPAILTGNIKPTIVSNNRYIMDLCTNAGIVSDALKFVTQSQQRIDTTQKLDERIGVQAAKEEEETTTTNGVF